VFEALKSNHIVASSPPDSLLLEPRTVNLSPVAVGHLETDATGETDLDKEASFHSTRSQRNSREKNDDLVLKPNDGTPDASLDVLPAAPTQFEEEEEERRVKLTQWVRQIRAAVQETIHHYRHYIHLLQQQKSSSGASVPQQKISSYESELHSLHCQLQQIQYEYQQTVGSMQDLIERQSQTIRNLRKQQPPEVGKRPLPVENPSFETAAESIASFNGGTQRVATAPTPIISPNSSSSSNKENRFSDELSQPEGEIEGSSHESCGHRSHTVSARIIPSDQKNCKTIQFHNGTVKEIYYAPSSSSSAYGSSRRHRRFLYEIIRFPNGDIKMTTTPAKSETEMYYYYAASGIIQLTYSTLKSSKSAQRVTEYHYPNGQVEYHYSADDLVVVKCPNGQVLHRRRTKQPPNRRLNDKPRDTIPGRRSSTLHG
jgi:hypothetical protein